MKKRVAALTLSLLLLVALCACAPKKKTATIFAMDTIMEFTAYGKNAQAALQTAREEIGTLERCVSAHLPESDIGKANAAHGETVALRANTAELLKESLSLCEATGGALDITIYPAMEAWGFPSGEHRVPDHGELTALCEKVDYAAVRLDGTQLTVPDGMRLDLGAVGKGYAGDCILAQWKDMGVTSGLLNLGGNVQCLGAKPDGTDWTVAVRAPEDETEYLATVTGRDMAVVTSGAYQRNFIQDGVFYHHILDPETCAPADSGLTSVTIVGERGLLCDALSTAVYVMGMDRAAALWRERQDFEMILLTDAGDLWITAGLKGRVTPAEGLALRVIDG